MELSLPLPSPLLFQIPFFRLTQSLKCLPILASRRFSNPPCEAVVTGLGAVGAPLTRRTSARTFHLAGIALIAGSFVLLGLGSLAIHRGCRSAHFAYPVTDLEREEHVEEERRRLCNKARCILCPVTAPQRLLPYERQSDSRIRAPVCGHCMYFGPAEARPSTNACKKT